MVIDEGYIKYRCHWTQEGAIAPSEVSNLTRYRDALHRLNFIGEYPDGIGFGNLSQRVTEQPEGSDSSSHAFIISGTQTGRLATLTADDYARVTQFDPAQNTLSCIGARKASSESLTHGVIYTSHPAIRAVIHVHSPDLWSRALHQVPTTRAAVPYGTPEMAAETLRLFQQTPLLQQRIFAMAGHQDGVVTFGDSLQVAYRTLIVWAERLNVFSSAQSRAALQLPFEMGG